MDEPTANVYPATEALIRETIRTRFQDCTVLTVAHRLESVMECDRVLVIENGAVVEYDYPYLLLRDDHSRLTEMAKQGGDARYEHLKRLAEEVNWLLRGSAFFKSQQQKR